MGSVSLLGISLKVAPASTIDAEDMANVERRSINEHARKLWPQVFAEDFVLDL